jgi:uncharacterized protein (TIGR02391 family)
MRFDDLQLLRLIDESETSGDTSPLRNGLDLMQRMGQGQQFDWNREGPAFARELILAHRAGYVEWRDMSARNIAPADPVANASQWLQDIWEIRLTIAGRDRARGRIIQVPLSDPDEDDGRDITGMTLEDIARAIGDVYTGTQLPRFLRDSGIPEGFIPPFESQTKWAYIFAILEAMHEGGSGARRGLREFIGAWLEGRLHTAPAQDLRRHITALLRQQGWHLLDGRLVIGERTHEEPGPVTAAGRDVRVSALHPEVRQVAERYLDRELPEVAIFEAFKAVNNRVKRLTGSDLDGHTLMGQAFSDKQPMLWLADPATETGRNIQAGYRFLFMGAVQGLRNPDAHEQFVPLDEEEALEKLAFASMLMRRLDDLPSTTDAP